MFISSRSFEEYCAFFDLAPQALPPRILDSCAGAASFTAEARTLGSRVVAADPAYADKAELLRAVAAGYETGTAMADAHAAQFDWSWYGTRQRRERLRHQAREVFLDDLATAPSHYVAAALPCLPFATQVFDLAVCSHLLFTWALDFDAAFHRAALHELLRVAAEVRVFPLVHRATGAPVEFVPQLVEELRQEGVQIQRRRVPYAFQRGADTMLVLSVGRR